MVGQTISRYKILEKLGQGGMGEVWKAEDTRLGRQVSLKFLSDDLVSDPEIEKCFEREAKAAAALSHPNIYTIHEIDQAAGKTFLGMELVEGEPLDARIAKGPLPMEQALAIAGQIANGLGEAHVADCQGRHKTRPGWRRKSRPPIGEPRFLNGVVGGWLKRSLRPPVRAAQRTSRRVSIEAR